MKKTILFTLLAGFALLLSACGVMATNDVEAADTSGGGIMESVMGGMGGGMMSNHHTPIPEEYAGLTNPIPADDASIARGGETYATHCATCHGDGGMGDGPAGESLDPVPASIAHTSQMLGDDYQFWRISEGGAMEPFNSGMIAWGGILDEDQRWDVINYVQALGSGDVMPGEHMGGAAFDPAIEAAKQTEMLADAVEQGVITEEEAAVFEESHGIVDGQMMVNREAGMSGSMDDMMADILVSLVESGELTQAQADTFLSVHDRLAASGLMQ